MFTKLRMLTAALVLLVGSAGLAAAHTTGTLHYAAACSTGVNTYNPFFHVLRPNGFDGGDPATWGKYISVQSETYVIQLQPCTGASTSAYGFSLVNAANAEVMAGTGQSYAFVQLGYAEQACVAGVVYPNPGACWGGFQPYTEDFWWTDSDSDHGGINVADWVDFNGGGHDRPFYPDRYRFTISRTTSGLPAYAPQWKFCVTVVVAASGSPYSNGQQSCKSISRSTAGYINRAYWGGETYNDASAMGTGSYGTYPDMHPMQYKNWNGSIYSTVGAPPTVVCNRIRLDGTNRIPWNSQKCDITEVSGESHLDFYTVAHT